MNKKRILILGGTAEARAIAALADERLGGIATVVTSLAGRTTAVEKIAGEVRTGGFGGRAGLARFIRDERIAAVVDATHPFAARISENARAACEDTATPRLYLARPRWTPPEGADIRAVADFAAAAEMTGKIARRCFLTIGTQGLDAFVHLAAHLAHVFFLVRTIEPVADLPFASHEAIIQRPPFTLAGERALMTRHAINALVTKESGGSATEAKIKAAAEMGIPVIMVTRPAAPEGAQAESAEDAVRWLLERVR